jgi:hypothetical protein
MKTGHFYLGKKRTFLNWLDITPYRKKWSCSDFSGNASSGDLYMDSGLESF